jgi:hypothetical protein
VNTTAVATPLGRVFLEKLIVIDLVKKNGGKWKQNCDYFEYTKPTLGYNGPATSVITSL